MLKDILRDNCVKEYCYLGGYEWSEECVMCGEEVMGRLLEFKKKLEQRLNG